MMSSKKVITRESLYRVIDVGCGANFTTFDGNEADPTTVFFHEMGYRHEL